MFFSLTDLTQNDFIIDEDFIRRGLARNEDEFYQTQSQKHIPVFCIFDYLGRLFSADTGQNELSRQ